MDWDIPVDYWVIEMHSGGERDQKVRDLLTKHNYREARVNMMSYCLKGHDCSKNELWTRF